MSGGSTAFVHYWRVFWSAIVTTIAGLRVTLKYLFSRPITVEYPDVLPHVPDGWRGLHAFERDRCIRCRMCERICPTQCITIDLEGKGKEALLRRYQIDYGMCLFCNLCAEVCPTECLWMAGDWDLACYGREDCAVGFESRNPDEERRRLWPSMKDSAVRLKEKGGRAEAASSGPGARTKSDSATAAGETHA